MTTMRVPFHFDVYGGVAVTNDPVRQISERLRALLSTQLTERVMRPTYGGGVADLLFEPNDGMTASIIETRVTDAITNWEPEIAVVNVTAQSHAYEPSQTTIEVLYRFADQDELDDTLHRAVIDIGGSVREIA